MKHQWIGLGLAGLLAVAVPAYAQQAKGDNEFQLQGSVSIGISGQNKTDFGSVEMKYGRFITDYQQLGLEVTGFITGNNSIAGYGGPFYRYNFSKDKVVPYVGVGAAAYFGSQGIGKGATVDFEGGVRYFLDRRTAFTAAATTGYSFDNHTFADNLQFLVGFSHLW